MGLCQCFLTQLVRLSHSVDIRNKVQVSVVKERTPWGRQKGRAISLTSKESYCLDWMGDEKDKFILCVSCFSVVGVTKYHNQWKFISHLIRLTVSEDSSRLMREQRLGSRHL